MLVRLATMSDIDDIMHLYDVGRQAMRGAGNDLQWINGYPSRELVEDDIARQSCFLVVGDDGLAHGVFMFAVMDDPTYHVIEQGEWLNDEPYGVIHRIASDGRVRGVLSMATEFALKHADNVRVDTHEVNIAMRGGLEKAGFTRCGIIYCTDGTPRVAYHLRKEAG